MGCQNSKNVQQEGNSLLNTRKDNQAKKAWEKKVVLLGDPNVGKSSIAQRFCKNVFSNTHIATIGGAYLQNKVVLENGESIKLHIWDTGGQERFRAMASLYYKDAAAAILTYDITEESSLENLCYWIEELKNTADNKDILLCLAGNKCDANENRKITLARGKEFADQHGMSFYETSAKLGNGVTELFTGLAQKLYDIETKK